MRIIFGATSFDRDKQARETIEARNRNDKKHGNLPLVGVQEHRALHPHLCEDCGQTFWDSDEYGLKHPRCKGFAPNATGF